MGYTNDWMREGACSGRAGFLTEKLIDKIFFTSKGRPPNNPPFKDYCCACPVNLKCLKYAVAHDLDGVWGNTTRSQRATLPQDIVLEIIQEAIVEGWYEPKLVHVIAISPALDLTLQMMQLEGSEPLSETDFLFPFEWIDYQRTIERIVESYEGLPGE